MKIKFIFQGFTFLLFFYGIIVHAGETFKAGIFDGAGSIIQPGTDCWGCNKDEARMHPHPGTGSTVAFQWRSDETCPILKIGVGNSSGDIVDSKRLNVIVKAKDWSEHLTQKAFKATLPLTITKESAWTLVAITSQESISSTTSIIAKCAKSSINSPKQDISKDLVDLTYGYFWAGNGSIIADSANGSDYGTTHDIAITYTSNNAMTIFQWQPSNQCRSLKLGEVNNANISEFTNRPIKVNEIKKKEWHYFHKNSAGVEDSWGNPLCNGKLPCTITAPANSYILVKIKTGGSAVPSGYIGAICQ